MCYGMANAKPPNPEGLDEEEVEGYRTDEEIAEENWLVQFN